MSNDVAIKVENLSKLFDEHVHDHDPHGDHEPHNHVHPGHEAEAHDHSL